MELTHVFLDEFGNANLDDSKAGNSTHFIIAAILVPESKVSLLTNSVEEIRKREFQTGEIKSKNVGNNHKRRVRILKELAKLDFNVLLLVIDKQKILKECGLQYKKSFYKYLYEIVYKHLHTNIARLRLHNDGMGDRAFLNGFVKYAKIKNPTPTLFEEFEISFEDSKSNVIIQLADFIAGSVARNIDKTKIDPNNTINYVDIIKNHLFPILYFPRSFEEYLVETKFTDEEDRSIAEICCRKARNYIISKTKSDDEFDHQRTAILHYLLYRIFNNPTRNYIGTKELIGYLSRLGYKTLSKVTFRNKIIAAIRDSGVPIASSKFGYKIPTKIYCCPIKVEDGNGVCHSS
ncbi:MAG: DUF3800 domain-containing protein, partial [Muribaculaceae bacterium]